MLIAKDARINREIRAREVRVIDPEGKQLGVLPLVEALRLSTNFELDLVEVSSKSDPPVCRIMDYGKFKYQQSKKQQEARRRQTTIQVKEVKVRPKIEEHDMAFKLKHIRRFLADRDKVKVTMIFRGREMAHQDRGYAILKQMAEALVDVALVEQEPKHEGRTLFMIMAPK